MILLAIEEEERIARQREESDRADDRIPPPDSFEDRPPISEELLQQLPFEGPPPDDP